MALPCPSEILLAEYGIGKVLSCTPLLGGWVKKTYLLRCLDERSYVCYVFPPRFADSAVGVNTGGIGGDDVANPTAGHKEALSKVDERLEEMEHLHQLLHFVAAAKLPVNGPYPRLLPAGASASPSFVLPLQSPPRSFLSVTRFIRGSMLSARERWSSPATAHHFGREMGVFIARLQNLSPPEEASWVEYYNDDGPCINVERPLKALRAVRSSSLASRLPELSARIEAFIDRASSILETHDGCGADALSSLPVVICHSDLHDQNVLWDTSEATPPLAGVIDFDSAFLSHSLLDFSCGLLFWCCEAAPSYHLSWEVVRTLRSAFERERLVPLSEQEWRLQRYFLILMAVLQLAGILHLSGSQENTAVVEDIAMQVLVPAEDAMSFAAQEFVSKLRRTA